MARCSSPNQRLPIAKAWPDRAHSKTILKVGPCPTQWEILLDWAHWCAWSGQPQHDLRRVCNCHSDHTNWWGLHRCSSFDTTRCTACIARRTFSWHMRSLHLMGVEVPHATNSPLLDKTRLSPDKCKYWGRTPVFWCRLSSTVESHCRSWLRSTQRSPLYRSCWRKDHRL